MMSIQLRVAIQIICFFLVMTNSQRIVNFTQLAISSYNINHEWGQIYSNLQGQDISGLVFKEVIVCEQGLKMVLGLDEVFNSLRSLELSRINGFNENIMKILVRPVNVQFLTKLVLDGVSLEDKDILHFPTNTQLSLEELSLAENFISEEGMNHLSKMKMNKLRSLNLYLASLASNTAVDSLLRFNLSNLERINIGFTSISSENALRAISALNLSKLTHLNITYNNFDISFYKGFSEFNFASLQSLDLSNLLIDEDIVPYFKQMRFPELIKLSIGKNQFFVDGHYSFLNKKNYPKLKSLSVGEVVFSQYFFQFLAKEFGGTPFQQLVLVGEGIEPQIFYYLKILNLSQLRKLVVDRGLMKTDILYPFLENSKFEKLQELKMEYVTNSGSILHKILEKIWPNLKILRLGRIGRTNFTLLSDQTSSIKLPKLQVIAMDVRGFNSSQIALLIQYLSRTCAQPIKIEMIVQYSFPHIQELAIKQPKVKHTVSIQLKIYQITIISSKKITVFSAIIQNDRKIIIQEFKLKRIVSSQFSVNHPNPNFQSPKFVDFVKLKSQFYFSHFDFNKIKKMEDFSNCELFKQIKNVSKSQNGRCIFPHMKNLMLQISNGDCYKQFTQCKFPNLIKLSLKFQHFQYFTNNSNQYFLPQNLSQLIELHLEGQVFIPNDKVLQMFKRQNFSSIHRLVLNSSDLRSEEISEILAQPGVQRVRNITIFQGWVHNLTFIKDNNLKLRYLDITATLIGSQLYQLSEMNFQFLDYLKFGGAGIKDNDLIHFLANKTQKQGNSFPKLQVFALNRNQIEYEGMKLLAQSKMPYVNDLFFVINNNPDILNQMFGSTFRRITRLILYHNMQDSVDPNLPIKNTRQLQFIFLYAAELDAIDFEVLSRLDFSNLREIQIVFNQFFECQSLIPLLKTIKSIRSLIFDVDKIIQLASSQCLLGNSSNDLNLKHLIRLQIQLESCFYSNMRKLFDHIIFQQTLQILLLVGVYPSEKAFRRLVQQSNLDHISTLVLRSNDLNDDMVKQIFNRDLREIRVLNLGLNEKLTSQAISKMKNRTYPILFQLLLDSTKIDDSGIETLLSCFFPLLQKLDLSNTQLTSKSLLLLSNFSAPNLNTINLSSNNLLATDLYNLNVKIFAHLKQIIIYPNLRKYEVDLLSEYLNKDRSDKIDIVTDIIHEEQIHYHQQESDEIDDDNDDHL